MLFEGQRTPEVMAFQKEVQRLQRAVLGANAAAGEARTMVDDLETAFERVPLDSSDEIQNEIEALRSNLRAVQWELNGDPTTRQRAESSPFSVRSPQVVVASSLAYFRAVHSLAKEPTHVVQLTSNREQRYTAPGHIDDTTGTSDA